MHLVQICLTSIENNYIVNMHPQNRVFGLVSNLLYSAQAALAVLFCL